MPGSGQNPHEDDAEDDYLSMTFDDNPKTSNGTRAETSLQRTTRLKKEALERGRVPSKTELAARAAVAREKALATELDSSNNKGAQMLAKMGFKKGDALGRAPDARTQPIELLMKTDRSGIGMESERKRKIREEVEAAGHGLEEKRAKVTIDPDVYRERNRLEAQERRLEGQMWAAMRVLERLETSARDESESANVLSSSKDTASKSQTEVIPLKSINILYRPLAKQRLEKERDRRMRYDLTQSLSRRSDYNDPDADEDDKLAFGVEEQELLDDVDPELEALEQKPLEQRVDELVKYLRETFRYCFWCKFSYPDAQMEGCPGFTAEEHG